MNVRIECQRDGKWHYVGSAMPKADYPLFGRLAGVRVTDPKAIAANRGLPPACTLESFLLAHRSKDGKPMSDKARRLVQNARRIGADCPDIIEVDRGIHTVTWVTSKELECAIKWREKQLEAGDSLVDSWHLLLGFAKALPDARLILGFDS